MTLDPEAMSMESKNCPQVVTSTEFTTTINMDASTGEESQVNQSNLLPANAKETASSNEPADHRSSSSQNHHHESGHHLTNGHPSDHHHHHHHTSSHRPLDVVFNNISVAVKQSTNSRSKSKTNTRIFDIFSSIKSKLKSSSSSPSSNDPSLCPSNLPQNQNSGTCNNNQSSSNRYILQSISGSAVPGQILGIMGPSGSGKTTLLSTLSGRLKIDEGSITMNGELLNKQLRRKICYVLQQDIFFPDLTLRQTLLYTALLRLPESMDYEKKVKHVDNIIDVLDLRQCQHTIIGDMAKRGLSGGEKKRASIACELLTNPSVLLIDEPTSGLDSSTAHSLMQLLKSYAVKEKKTIIITIHQPSSQIFHMFDKLLLLTTGQLAYFGQTDSVVPFFDSLGYRMSTHFNPADFVLERIKNGNQEETRVIVTAAKSLVESSIDFHSNGHAHHHHHSSSHVHGGHHHHHHSRKSSHGQTDDFPTSDHPLLGSDHEVWPSNESSDGHDPEHGHNHDGHKSEGHQMRTIVVIDGDGHERKVTTMNDCDSGRSSWSEADRSSTKTFSSNSSSCSDDLNALENGHHACSVSYDKWATSFWTQLRILTKRNFYEARGRMLSKLNWIQTIGLALVTGCIWYQIPRSEETLNDIKGWMFFSMTYWMLFALFNALVSFPPEREVINKERASGAYRLSSYYIAKMIGELPLTLAMPTTFHFISYPMLGCYNISTFFYLWIFQILSSVVAQSVGLFVGAATVDLEVSITISALYSMSSILFGGFYSTTMPYWLSWLRYLSIVYYALQNMLQIEFSIGEPIRCSSEGGGVSKYASCQFGNKSESFIPYEELKLRLDTMNYGSEPLPIWLNTIILILFLIFFRGMGYLVLKYIRKPK